MTVHNPYLTQQEVADLYQTSIENLRRLRRLGKGPAYIKEGRTYIYSVAAIVAHLEANAMRLIQRNGRWPWSDDIASRAGSDPKHVRMASRLYRDPLYLFDTKVARLLLLPLNTLERIVEAGMGPTFGRPQLIDGYYVFYAIDTVDRWQRWFMEQATDEELTNIAEFLHEDGYQFEPGVVSARDFVLGKMGLQLH